MSEEPIERVATNEIIPCSICKGSYRSVGGRAPGESRFGAKGGWRAVAGERSGFERSCQSFVLRLSPQSVGNLKQRTTPRRYGRIVICQFRSGLLCNTSSSTRGIIHDPRPKCVRCSGRKPGAKLRRAADN